MVNVLRVLSTVLLPANFLQMVIFATVGAFSSKSRALQSSDSGCGVPSMALGAAVCTDPLVTGGVRLVGVVFFVSGMSC